MGIVRNALGTDMNLGRSEDAWHHGFVCFVGDSSFHAFMFAQASVEIHWMG
jgi:hypothetical protein